MKARFIWNNLKAIPRPWWALWALGMVLLALMWLKYPTAAITAYIEARADFFRAPFGFLPIHVLMIRGATELAPGVAIASSALVMDAGAHPKRSTACMAGAVGVILLYFAMAASELGFAAWCLLRMVAPDH